MDKMSQQQWKRIDVLERLSKRKLTQADAAMVLGLSERHVKRLLRAFKARGREAVVHGNSGRAPPNRKTEALRAKVLRLWRQRYRGFNDTHFTEKLQAREGIDVSRQTVRRWLREAGERPARPRRARRHRSRRDRKPQAGQMLLWDGSRHAWLEERGPMLCLMGAIDDATGELLPGAHFVEQECSAGYLRVLREVVAAHGIPLSIYMDRHGSLRRNDDYWTLEEELRGEQDPTQVGRALRALDIEMLFALSPQAKGRVERLWGTLQDRLVSELRLANACTAQQANAVLEKYRAEFNARFARAPADAEPAWRRLRAGTDLDRVCSFFHETTVGNDNAVRIAPVVIDIPAGPGGRGYAHARVEVRQLLDASWRVYLADAVIATAEPTTRHELRAPRRKKRPAASRAFRRAIDQVASSLP
jgi:transposase